jgi:predicted membrane chloride channel (bestrophin family)
MLGLRFINAIDALNLTVWSIITISLSLLVAFRGNCAWHQLANLLRWW